MAKKLDSIVELAAQKTREISANSGNYMAFLTTAAHNFKYNFRDQPFDLRTEAGRHRLRPDRLLEQAWPLCQPGHQGDRPAGGHGPGLQAAVCL